MDKKIIDLPKVKPGKRDASVMKLQATIEGPTKQELRRIRPYTAACLHIPADLIEPAQLVLKCLFDCFEKQQSVEEGLVGDLIWGFSQTGVPPQATILGLDCLQRAGYIRLQAKDNAYITLQSDRATVAFVRYQPKLLEMVYEPLKEKT